MIRATLVAATLGWAVGQVPDSPSLDSPVGFGVAGVILVFCYWRLRIQDGTIKEKDAALQEVNLLLIKEVIPALDSAKHTNDEVRAALVNLIEQNKRREDAILQRIEDLFRNRQR